MTAKEYLQQLYKADVIIKQRIQEKEDIRARLSSIGSFDYTKDRVQVSASGDASYVKQLEKIIDLENDINRLFVEYFDMKHRVIGQLHALNNADQIKILYKRYVLGEKFEQIAVDLNFSISNVYKIHGYGLREFQKIHLKNERV